MLKLVFLFLLLFFTNLSASLVEVKESININVLPHSSILSSEKKLSLNEVIINENWKKIEDDIISFKYSTIPRWIKFDIKRFDSNKIFLEYGFTLVDIINIYIVDNKSRVVKEYKTGINKVFTNRPINSNKFIFPIDIEKNNTYTIYVETLNSFHPNLVSLRLYTQDFFYKRDYFYNFITGSLIVVLSIMFFYNLIIYISIKFTPYKYYLAYLLSTIILVIAELGYLYKFFIPNEIFLNKMFIDLAELIFLLTLTFFMKNILELKKSSFLNRALNFTLLLSTLLCFIHIFLTYINLTSLIYISFIYYYLVLIVIILILIGIFNEYKKGNKTAKLLIFPWSFPLLSIFIYVLNRMFFFIEINVISIITQIALMIESMLMSLIIALKINYIEQEKNELILKEKNTKIMLLQHSKFVIMGKMLSNITHQWKQPLSRLNAIILDMNISLPKKYNINNYLDLIEGETNNMSKTISTFSKYFHPDKNIEKINLFKILNEIIKLYKHEFEKKNVIIKINCSNNTIFTMGYKEELKQVLIVLFDNILDSFKKQKGLKKMIICEIGKENNLPFLCVENTGNNILIENIDQIFEPYFSTKSGKKNEGLGLYIGKMLVEESMNKKLEVFNTNRGVKFCIKG